MYIQFSHNEMNLVYKWERWWDDHKGVGSHQRAVRPEGESPHLCCPLITEFILTRKSVDWKSICPWYSECVTLFFLKLYMSRSQLILCMPFLDFREKGYLKPDTLGALGLFEIYPYHLFSTAIWGHPWSPWSHPGSPWGHPGSPRGHFVW